MKIAIHFGNNSIYQMEKYCLACGTLITGRIDKKFCDHYCRSEFNNSINKGKNMWMRKINKILNRNKLILEKFVARKKLSLTVDILTAAGFDFRYYTHQETDEEDMKYIFCYEYGYRIEKGKEVRLKKVSSLEE